MITLSRPVVGRTLGAAASAGLVLALLAGCSSSPSAVASTSGTGNNTGNTSGNTSGNNTGQNANPGFPGVNGQIAAVTGKTLQVQNTTAQTAVTYTDSTKLTQVVNAAESDLAVGKCVSVRPVMSTTPAAGSTIGTPTAPDLSAPVSAASVSISDAVNGSCGRGAMGGGFGGGRRGAGQTGAPAGSTGAANGTTTPANGANPNGGGGGARGGFGGGGVNGTIASISGDTMTVTMTRPAATSGSTDTSGTTTTVTRTVTLDSSTTYTKTESASDSDLTVGKCVSAVGTSDANGALTANSISIRPAVNGACSTGFGGGRNRGANAAAAGTAQTG